MTDQDKKIDQLAAASSLSGTEIVPVIQGGVTKRTTTANIAGLVNLALKQNINSVSTLRFDFVDLPDSNYIIDQSPGNKIFKIQATASRNVTINSGLNGAANDPGAVFYIINDYDSTHDLVIVEDSGVTVSGTLTITPGSIAMILKTNTDTYYRML
jgi:hypothetical protein